MTAISSTQTHTRTHTLKCMYKYPTKLFYVNKPLKVGTRRSDITPQNSLLIPDLLDTLYHRKYSQTVTLPFLDFN